MGEVYEYDKSAPNNNSAPPNGWPENQAYNTVNNCAREMMAADARDLADRNGTLLTTGTNQAYTITPNRSVSTLVDGLIFGFRCHFTNAGLPTTLDVGTGPVDVQMADGSDPVWVTNGVYQVIYNAQTQNFQMLSATAGESAAVTISVISGNYTFTIADLDGQAKYLVSGATSPANPITLTLPVALSSSAYYGKRLRILNPDKRDLQFNNNLSGVLYRSDSSATISSGGSGTGTGVAYTIVLYNGAGLLLNSLA